MLSVSGKGVSKWPLGGAVDGVKQQPDEREARADTYRCCLETQLTGGFAGSQSWVSQRTNKEAWQGVEGSQSQGLWFSHCGVTHASAGA